MDHFVVKGNIPEPSFDVPPEHIIQSSKEKNWPGVDIAEIVHPLDDFALPAINRHVLVFNLGSPSELQERLAGRQGHLGTGGIVILPAGAPSTWHLEREGEVRHLHLYLSPTLLHKVAAEADINPDTLELIGTLGTHDPQIEAIVLSFFSELRSDGMGTKVYVESLANLLIVQLLRHHSSAKQPAQLRQTALPQTIRRRVIDYIEDSLTEDLSLSDIAAVANLSPYHFARLFKQAFGLAPHQYVIRRRIERAKLLLSTTNQSLTSIAHKVGFASANHLTTHFKRLTGLSPTHYRQ